MKRILKTLLSVTKVVIEGCWLEDGNTTLVVKMRPTKGHTHRCPICGRKSPYYDEGRGVRRWRALDTGTVKACIEAGAPRVMCEEHGVLVACVPWARHGSWFTYAFEQQVAWLALKATKSAVSELMRIHWDTVGDIIARVYEDAESARGCPRFDNLVDIGIDETSYKKGQKYITVVVDHDAKRVIWAHKGHGKAVLDGFFKELTDEQKASIRCVSADGARWIAACVEEHCPNAERVMDPFHVVSWLTDCLDGLRKEQVRQAKAACAPVPKRKPGTPKKGEGKPRDVAKDIKGLRYSLLKNAEDLTDAQQARFDLAVVSNRILYTGWRLKERLRLLLKLPIEEAAPELDAWLSWACRCRIPRMVELSRKIRRHRQAILAAVERGLSNARIEAFNNKIKVTIRMAYGFRNIDNLISMVMLRCSNLGLALPGRA